MIKPNGKLRLNGELTSYDNFHVKWKIKIIYLIVYAINNFNTISFVNNGIFMRND